MNASDNPTTENAPIDIAIVAFVAGVVAVVAPAPAAVVEHTEEQDEEPEEEAESQEPLETNDNTNFCSYCNKPEPVGTRFKQCEGCRSVSYCSPNCQSMHWKKRNNGHKKQCKKLNPFACDQCKGVLKHRATCPTLNLSANKLKEKAAHQKSNNKEARTARATRNRSKHTSSSSTHTSVEDKCNGMCPHCSGDYLKQPAVNLNVLKQVLRDVAFRHRKVSPADLVAILFRHRVSIFRIKPKTKKKGWDSR